VLVSNENVEGNYTTKSGYDWLTIKNTPLHHATCFSWISKQDAPKIIENFLRLYFQKYTPTFETAGMVLVA